jgi:hypothetical protein
MLPQAKFFAIERGVSVNGLAITSDFPHLDDWYRNNVIVGPGSFVIKAKGFNDFKRAIKEKLGREFTSLIAENGRPDTGRYQTSSMPEIDHPDLSCITATETNCGSIGSASISMTGRTGNGS